MSDFLADNNSCGQVILNLVSRGNAIISELLRLKDYIPNIYRLESKQDVQKYSDIILDFNYFKISESHEQKIEANEALRDLDEEFRDNHIEIIKRFYLVFEGIHAYITDLNHFIDELNEGMYIHQTLENVFTDIEGKQVMCEALYLYGLMLIIVDAYIEGVVRERLLVSYYRYAPQRQDTKSCIDEVCKLLRDTGYAGAKKPSTYPEDYFKRIFIKPTYIDYAIGCLRSDDIYSQVSVYPLPKHRSTALANQASMLYVCLFFSTDILHFQTAVMREIVDKFFPDNWTISLYMGYTVNLIVSWDAFKAAKSALNNTLEVTNVKSYASTYGSNVPNLLKKTSLLLKEGNITSENLLKDINNLITTIRECNVTLRWLMLHTVLKRGQTDRLKRSKQLTELVITEAKCERELLFRLLLNTAQLELVVRDLYKQLLTNKETQWEELKTETNTSLLELSEVFGGSKPLTRIPKNEKLQLWFVEISKEVQSLSQENSSSSRKIVLLIQALEEVQEFHQLDNNMQVIQFLSETRKYLDQMARTMTIKEDILINLQIIGDLSYAWELINEYTNIMQLGIRREPTLVIKMRAVFLKLSSALEIPLLRINQAHSEDLISVSQYYSKELEIYVRNVLHIIPSMMFEKLARIIEMQTTVLKELPTRVDKDKIKDYTQLDERFEFAELTNSISVFSQGMRMMKSTLVGVVRLDPKQLLEDGIRKELVQHISKALHDVLIFSPKAKYEELDQKLKNLVRIMDGYKRSFEYIQDYINVNGLKIWQEEVTRIINYNVEQECNGFLRFKVHPWQSVYQNRYVPIPIFPSIDQSVNFIGRLAREVIRLTDPRSSVYLDTTVTWYENKTHKQIINKQTIASIASAIEIAGLVGLDRLFSFMIVNALQKLIGYFENKNVKIASWTNIISSIQKEMKQSEEFVNPLKIYQTYVNRCTKIWGDFLENILLVGQLQLLRNLIAFYLNTSCKFNAKNLEFSLRSLDKALLMDIQNDRHHPSENLLESLSTYFDYAGLYQPFNKIYTTSANNLDHSVTMFIFVISHLHKLFLPQNAGNVNKRAQDQIDGIAFSVGVHTTLRQFHSYLNREFIRHLSNYTLQLTKHNSSLKATDLLPEVSIALKFMESYTNYSEETRKFYRESLPPEILHIQQTLCPTTS
ncbi:WASH complex subunit 5 isoform X1 [Diabrotica virgifera virgifera]|uniref:WASH complex subunit 5 n=1 Tax=Diabrotica virgifera virgifera TaxID=50390 RepID=A0ABM5K3T1_DIAVI|nr:WASH complex subunit 5 isoform X1 [Diabrotica virgifera virgifera]